MQIYVIAIIVRNLHAGKRKKEREKELKWNNKTKKLYFLIWSHSEEKNFHFFLNSNIFSPEYVNGFDIFIYTHGVLRNIS